LRNPRGQRPLEVLPKLPSLHHPPYRQHFYFFFTSLNRSTPPPAFFSGAAQPHRSIFFLYGLGERKLLPPFTSFCPMSPLFAAWMDLLFVGRFHIPPALRGQIFSRRSFPLPFISRLGPTARPVPFLSLKIFGGALVYPPSPPQLAFFPDVFPTGRKKGTFSNFSIPAPVNPSPPPNMVLPSFKPHSYSHADLFPCEPIFPSLD